MSTNSRFSNHRPWLLSILLALCFVFTTLAQPPASEAKKPRRPKKNKPAPTTTTETPPPAPPAAPNPALAAVERKLLAFETQDARRQLESSGVGGDAAGLVALGKVLIQEKKLAEAAAELQKAANLAPADPAPWVALGAAHEYAKKKGDAQSAFSKAQQLAQAKVAANGQDAQAHYCLGVAQQNLGQLDAAVASLEKARQLDGGNAEVVYQLGLTRVYQQRWAEGIDLLTQALGMNSKIAYAYYYRGQAASKTGDKNRLVEDLNKFLGMAPDAPEAPLAQRLLQSVGR